MVVLLKELKVQPFRDFTLKDTVELGEASLRFTLEDLLVEG